MSVKIVNVIGGLGNQMFQYAFAIALQNEYPDSQIKINKSCFRGYNMHDGFQLERIFDIKLEYASVWDLMKYAYPWISYQLWRLRRYLPERKSMTKDSYFRPNCDLTLAATKSYFDGYWQSPKYFEKYRDKILDAFKMPEIRDEKNLEALQFITQSKTAFIHVRRGDYLTHPHLGHICTEAYYSNAIKELKGNFGYNRFVIFSNEMNWCREKLPKLLSNSEICFVDWNSGVESYRDMQLMEHCSAGIVANSSFSWWGAWLGNKEIVLSPERWTDWGEALEVIVPKDWIRIPIE